MAALVIDEVFEITFNEKKTVSEQPFEFTIAYWIVSSPEEIAVTSPEFEMVAIAGLRVFQIPPGVVFWSISVCPVQIFLLPVMGLMDSMGIT